jgi:Ca2+-binding EF-hand superfamily protein
LRSTSLTIFAACLVGLAASESSAQGPGPGGPEGREGGRMMMMPPNPLLQALDTDGDGELSAKEIENASVSLKKLDKDKNGKLTRDEIRPAFGPGGPGGMMAGPNPQELVTRLLAFDKDGDGKLSKAELPERLQAMMDRGDTNKDGFLDKAELTRLSEAQSRRGPGYERRGEGEGGREPRRPPGGEPPK